MDEKYRTFLDIRTSFVILKKTNNFFAEVYDSMEKFAKIAVPVWSNAQLSNAKLGKAYADTLE